MRSLVAPKCVLSRLLEAVVEGSAPPQIARPARLEGGGDGTTETELGKALTLTGAPQASHLLGFCFFWGVFCFLFFPF